MSKTCVNQLPKFLVPASLLIVSILLFISIINEYAAHKRYLEYQKISNNNTFDKSVPEKQIHLLTKNVSIHGMLSGTALHSYPCLVMLNEMDPPPT